MPQRLGALIIDSIPIVLLQAVLTRSVASLSLRVQRPSALHGAVTFGISSPPLQIWPWAVAITVVYYALFEALFAATPGKLLMRLRVVDLAGRRVSPPAALARNLLRPLDAAGGYVVGFIVCIASPRRQRIGDHAARTLVADLPSVHWEDTARRAALRRTYLALGILVAALAADVSLSYLHPPSMTPAASEQFYPLTTMGGGFSAQFGAGPLGAQRLLSLAADGPYRNGSTIRYHIRYTVALRHGKRDTCQTAVYMVWRGVMQGWGFDGAEGACRPG